MIIHLKVIQMTKKFIIWEGFYALPFCMLDLKKRLCYTEFATQLNSFAYHKLVCSFLPLVKMHALFSILFMM